MSEMMNREQFHALIIDLGACEQSVDWVVSKPDEPVRILWMTCVDPSWLMWISAQVIPFSGVLRLLAEIMESNLDVLGGGHHLGVLKFLATMKA